jgi:hypothetical protein
VELRDIDPTYVRDYVDHYLNDNPWCAVPELQIPGRIRTDRSLDEYYRKPGYYKSTEFYNDWMRPQGFIHSLSTNLLSDGDLRTKFYMYRNRHPGSFSRDEIRRFEHLSGHLMRAVGIAYRLNTRESGVAGGLSVLDHLRFGVILLDSGLRIVHANRFAETLLQGNDGLHLRDSMVRALHADDSRELERILRTRALGASGVEHAAARGGQRTSCGRPASLACDGSAPPAPCREPVPRSARGRGADDLRPRTRGSGA